MEFKYEGKKVQLRGTHKSNLVWISDKKSKKNARQVVQGEFHSMTLSVYPMNAISCSNLEGMSMEVDERIKTVLKNYEDVFGILVELPPQRQLNKQTVKDKFPIPIIEELIDELHGSKLTHEGHYEFLVMPFGLTNAPSTFQSLMNECVFGAAQVEYLGHVISAKGVATDPTKIEAMANWHVPTSLKQLRGFLGLTGYYRRFIKSFAMISRPLTQLLKKELMSGIEFTIETNASRGGIGAVLLQEGHPIAFFSKTLSTKHQIMSTYEKEFQLKWLPKIMGFDFAIVYKKGVDNVTDDALSRLHNPAALLSIIGTTNVTTDLYNRIVDIIEKEKEINGLPKSQGKDVILVVVDRLSKYSHFMALSHHFTAYQVAQLFLDNAYKLHGLPENIMSDRDKIFVSSFWKELFKLLQVHLNMSTAYHPQSDGQTEVVNRCLECYLRCMTSEQPKQWLKWLSLAEWWYNTNFHTSIHTTPYEAVYGKPPPVHIPYIGGESKVDLVDKTLSEREEAVEALKFHINRAQSRMKSHADKGRTDRKFDCGDWVFLKLQPHRQVSLRQGKQNKFLPKFFGPFKVIQRIGEVAYKLDLPSNSHIHNVFHVSQLRKCRHPNPDQTSGTLPPCDSSGVFLVEPLTILDRRMAKKGNGMEIYVLVQWTNGTIEDATWEFQADSSLNIQLSLNDHGCFQEAKFRICRYVFASFRDGKNAKGKPLHREHIYGSTDITSESVSDCMSTPTPAHTDVPNASITKLLYTSLSSECRQTHSDIYKRSSAYLPITSCMASILDAEHKQLYHAVYNPNPMDGGRYHAYF
ncbi:retrotransposable element Tf2 [Tanacetum coccineum]